MDLFLAHRTEIRRTPALHDPLHRAVAARRNARFALAVVNAKMVLEISELAIGLAVIAQRRAAGLDGVIEHCLDGVDQRRRARMGRAGPRRDGRSAALRRNARPM